ncbi:MAG: glycosyl hydrolase [Fibrobacteres bacterium]|nr:glycosyl hydrolase [Fibrobacterota bacterium]
MGKSPVRGLIAAFLLSIGSPVHAVSPEQAEKAIQAFNKAYWNAPGKYFYKLDNKTGVLDFWMSAHVWETLMDAYVLTGKAEYKQQIKDMYDGFVARNGSDWTTNDYNDDIMWWVLAATRAYDITGEARYLTQAKTHFDWIYRNQRDTVLGGGIWWKNTEHNQKNSCVVQPAIISAANLARLLKDDGYRVKAESLYAWQKRTLVDPAGGKVYDAISSQRVVSKGSTTYNQGTFIGSAVALGRIAEAQKAADWTKANMCNAAGVLRNEGQGDFGTFKLILIRYVMGLSRQKGGEACAAWMADNGAAVWANRRSADDVMGFDWANPAPAAGIECQSAAGGVALLNLLAAPVVSITPLAGRAARPVGPSFRFPGAYPGAAAPFLMSAEGFRGADGRFQSAPACARISCTNSIP